VSQKTSDMGLDHLLREVEQEIDDSERAQATQPTSGQPTKKHHEQPHTGLLCSLGPPLPAAADNNMPQKLVAPSRGLKTESRYCGRLEGVLYAPEGGIVVAAPWQLFAFH